MKPVQILIQLYQKRNKAIGELMRKYREIKVLAEVFVLSVLAGFISLFATHKTEKTEEETISLKNSQSIVINCMGAVDVQDSTQYRCDLESIASLIEKADISLAMAHRGVDIAAATETASLLKKYGLSLLGVKDLFDMKFYKTEQGKIAVLSYNRVAEKADRSHIKLEFMRYIQLLRRKKADYIVVYVNNSMKNYSIDKVQEAKLYRLLSLMGADYIVGVTPNRLDGGTTYLKRDGGVARSVYSLGTFLSEDENLSNKRIVIRLKLDTVQGKLQTVEETYVPYYKVKNQGFISLIEGDTTYISVQNQCKFRSEAENEMRRISPADRVLTVGKIMEIINTELPEKYKYLEPFSVGMVCSRSFEVNPGDVFFFREPYDDPNDEQEPVNHIRQLRRARAAKKRGAMLLITHRELPFECRQVLCSNVMEAHISVCAYLRKQFNIQTVAITGSIGKTSTKDMLAEVTKMQYNTVKSEQNTNVQVKIGVNLQELTSSCEVYIQEIGGGRPGGASRHARMVLPNVTVVTNIGDAHIGNFYGSKEKLMANKLGIIEGMGDNGILYLNGDDPLLTTAKPNCNTVFYAIHNKNADYYAENLQEQNAGTSFDIVHKENRIPVRLNVMGEHNVLNAVCCFAIGKQLNIPEDKILTGLTHFSTGGIRQNLVEVCGRKFYMDCYNASLDSVKTTMDVLTKLPIEPGKKRIAVVGDITGMGELTEQIHREIGHTLSNFKVDHLILFGQSIKYAYEVLQEKGIEVKYITSRKVLNRLLYDLVDVGDVAGFKGSSKMLLEYSVDSVFGTGMTDQRLLDESAYKSVKKKNLSYNLFSEYATVSLYIPSEKGNKKTIVPSKIGNIPVVNLGQAFTNTDVREVVLPDSIRHIGTGAFCNCTHLEKIKLPYGLLFIDSDAFKNCCKLQSVDIPDGVLNIGCEAFSGCKELKQITIPASVVQIDENAFDGCGECQFIYGKGSYAEEYFRKNTMLE